jgi:DNA replication protein DnaC
MDLTKFIDGVEKSASISIKAEQGDYVGDDGLLYCHKCNTPKQCRVTILGVERTPMCLCKCEIEKREQEESERKRIEFQKAVVKIRQVGFPEAEMQNWDFAHDDGESGQIMNVARKYVENFDKMRKDGKGLLFFGSVGNGKTFAAACIANALIDKGYPCMMTNFARIANTVQGMFEGRQAYYDSFNKYALLVLDDLATERKTEYMQEIVFNVIDSRYRAGLPMIITSNLTADEIKNPADISYQRIFSRLLEMCVPVESKGEDRRRKILKNTFSEYSDILGI